jgi:hypothetical protein
MNLLDSVRGIEVPTVPSPAVFIVGYGQFRANSLTPVFDLCPTLIVFAAPRATCQKAQSGSPGRFSPLKQRWQTPKSS